MKNQIVVALIAVGAIVIAIPIFIFGLVRLVCDLGISSTAPKWPDVSKKLRHLAEAAEARIGTQTDNRTKLDSPS
jgi:hypothetical protein